MSLMCFEWEAVGASEEKAADTHRQTTVREAPGPLGPNL